MSATHSHVFVRDSVRDAHLDPSRTDSADQSINAVWSVE